VLQGFTGGAMVPTVFATGFAMFSGPQRAMIPAILGMVSVLAPTLGPTVGGWLTEAVGWRSIFYINIIPGALVTLLAINVIKVDRPNFDAEDHRLFAPGGDGDVPGRPGICAGGRPAQAVVRGHHIAIAAWVALVAFALFIERSFRSGGPIVKLTPFRKPTFAFACVFNLVIGFGLYSSTYLIPVFLGRVRGYNSLEIGTTVFVTGIAQILSTVIAARLSTRVDQRITISVGLTLFAAACG
jgi:DHA2 family multidrug resistance protein